MYIMALIAVNFVIVGRTFKLNPSNYLNCTIMYQLQTHC